MNRQRVKHLIIAAAVGATAAIGVGCDDPFAAFLLDVPENPIEATLFDLATGRLEDPPAYDIIREVPVRVDQTNQWDFLFQIAGGTPELVTFTAVTDSVTDAGLFRATMSFEEVLSAPTDGYTLSTPLSVAIGDVFVIRSRVDASQLLNCSIFAKIEVLDLDLAAGTLKFRLLGNPNCGDTVLEPGMHGSF